MSTSIAWRDLKRRIKRRDINLEEALGSPAAEGRLAVEIVALALLARSDDRDNHGDEAPAMLARADVDYGTLAHDLTPTAQLTLCKITLPLRDRVPAA